MFYQPDRKMSIAITTNSANLNPYTVAKALYAAMPDFLCGRKEKRVVVSFKGFSACVPRSAAKFLIGIGAYLGGSGGTMLQNGDSLSRAASSSYELTSIGMQKPDYLHNQLSVLPNPIRTNATINFTVAQSGITSLRVYDMNGKQVATLFNGIAEKGITQQIHFDAKNLSTGMYVAILQTKESTVQQKLIITR